MQPALPKQPKPLPQSNIGLLGESHAVSFLLKKSFTILSRNYRGGKGEIDIVARDRDTLVFIEVKTRTSDAYGTPKESVTKRKIEEVIRAGQYYCREHPNASASLRVDVVAVRIDRQTLAVQSVEHIVNVTG
jgi:putative endonuclease